MSDKSDKLTVPKFLFCFYCTIKIFKKLKEDNLYHEIFITYYRTREVDIALIVT